MSDIRFVGATLDGSIRLTRLLTSQLGHPQIVNVLDFDFGVALSGETCLVMEFLQGEDLEQRLCRVGRLLLGEAFRICKQLASALAVTHAKGSVHRDPKAASIFLLRLEGDVDSPHPAKRPAKPQGGFVDDL